MNSALGQQTPKIILPLLISTFIFILSLFSQTQGNNARKVISEVYAFLYCSVLSLGGKVNTRRMSQPDMESIFTKIIYEIFWSKETIMWIIKIIKNKCFYPPRLLDEHWCIYSCLQIPPRANWFQYVRRVYTTAINFPCISTLVKLIFVYFFFVTYSFHFSP